MPTKKRSKVSSTSPRKESNRKSQEIGKLKRALAAAEGDRHELTGTVGVLKMENERLEKNSAQLEEEVFDLRSRLKACQLAHARRSHDFNLLNNTIAEGRKLVDRLTASNAEQEAEIAHLNRTIRSMDTRTNLLRDSAILIGRVYRRNIPEGEMAAAEFFAPALDVSYPQLVVETALGLLAEAVVREG